MAKAKAQPTEDAKAEKSSAEEYAESIEGLPGTEETEPEKEAMAELDILDPTDAPIPVDEDEDESGGDEQPEDDGGDDEDSTVEEAVEEIDPELLSIAKDLGYSEDEARSFGNTAMLQRALEMVNKAFEWSQQAAPKPADEKKGDEKPEDPEYEVELGENWDEDLVNQFKKLNDHYKGKTKKMETQFAELQQKFDAVVSHVARQQTEAIVREVDGMIGKLGDEWKDVLGEGPSGEIDPNSQQAKNRLELMDEMEIEARILQEKYKGKRQPRLDDLFERALNKKYGNHQRKIAAKEISNKLTKRKKQAVGRATHRRSDKEMTPEERATASVSELMREKGMLVE